MADIFHLLAGIAANDPLDGLRDHRAQAKENAQLSFEALLEPADPKGVSFRDRYAVAAFTAGLLGSARAEEFYRDLLRDEDESVSWAVAELLDVVCENPVLVRQAELDGAAQHRVLGLDHRLGALELRVDGAQPGEFALGRLLQIARAPDDPAVTVDSHVSSCS